MKSASSTWGDFNNDGLIDLYLANKARHDYEGALRNHLYLNVGNGKFEQVREEAITEDLGATVSAANADYNKDGFLDIYVANTFNYKDALYRNNGNSNNWISFKLAGNKSNKSAIGATIRIKANLE
jgi:hypothetical protein